MSVCVCLFILIAGAAWPLGAAQVRLGIGFGSASVNDVALLSNGSLVATGSYAGLTLFDTTGHKSTGELDIFVVCVDASGTLLWWQTAGGAKTDEGTAARLSIPINKTHSCDCLFIFFPFTVIDLVYLSDAAEGTVIQSLSVAQPVWPNRPDSVQSSSA